VALPSAISTLLAKWPAGGPTARQHLAGLVGVVVDRLLAEDHQPRLLFFDQLEEDAGRGQRLHGVGGDHVDRPVCTHRQAIAQMRGEVGRPDTDYHDFRGDAFLAQAQRLFQRDVVERIGGQLDAVGDHTAAVGLDLDAHVVIHDALVADQNFHQGFLCGVPAEVDAVMREWVILTEPLP
jgi:hypothetical protein